MCQRARHLLRATATRRAIGRSDALVLRQAAEAGDGPVDRRRLDISNRTIQRSGSTRERANRTGNCGPECRHIFGLRHKLFQRPEKRSTTEFSGGLDLLFSSGFLTTCKQEQIGFARGVKKPPPRYLSVIFSHAGHSRPPRRPCGGHGVHG